jgi:hypothetical protein
VLKEEQFIGKIQDIMKNKSLTKEHKAVAAKELQSTLDTIRKLLKNNRKLYEHEISFQTTMTLTSFENALTLGSNIVQLCLAGTSF